MGAHLIIPGGTRVIDATGKYVFPGGIDANVHFETPYVKVNTVYLILLHTPSFLLEIRVIIKISKNPCYPINVD